MKKVLLFLAAVVVVGCATYEPRLTGSDHWFDRVVKRGN